MLCLFHAAFLLDAYAVDWSAPQVIEPAVTQLNDLHAADVDGDGDPDLIATRGGIYGAGEMLWYENLAGTLVGPARWLDALQGAASVNSGDPDGDGDLDIAAVSGGNMYLKNLSLYEGLGGGSFAPPTQFLEDTTQPSWLAWFVDVDGDGLDDLAQGGFWGAKWYRNTGLGFGFASLGTVIGSGGNGTTLLRPLDVDLDGDVDFIGTSTSYIVTPGSLFLMVNDGTGTFANEQTLSFSQEFLGADSADLDGDGDIDILSSTFTTLGWNANTDGSFGQRIEIGPTSGFLWVDAQDIDDDGDVDIVGTTATNVVVVENLGGAVFLPPQVLMTGAMVDHAILDVNQDGLPDVVTGGNGIHWFLNSPADADGDGSTLPDDCDDTNPDIRPGAKELCNGVDDNCDGDVDEGCVLHSGLEPTGDDDDDADDDDRGRPNDDADGTPGCGCGTQAPGPAWGLLVVLLVAGRRSG